MFPERELKAAVEFCKKENIRHIIIEVDELKIEGFSKNPTNRCYLCKRELFKKILEVARGYNIKNVIEGSNIDDEGDYRPGMQAIKELGVLSPLRTAGLSKAEIRTLSKEIGLPTAEKQSFACLSSRFVYGEEITEEKLKMVDKAEQLMLDLGFKQVRVRVHKDVARIEVLPEEFGRVLENRERIVKGIRGFGFNYVTLDLMGYRTGSMNEPQMLV